MKKDIIRNHPLMMECFGELKENIMKGEKPTYNPVYLFGLSKKERYRIFFAFFNKDFNQFYKGRYISCCKIELEGRSYSNYDFIILENLEFLVDYPELLEKVYSIINDCIKNEILIILCSDIDIHYLLSESNFKNAVRFYLNR